MGVFFRMFQHLLPRAKAWAITLTKPLRSFFEGLTGLGDDVREFFDSVWLDIFPTTTTQLDEWGKQFALPHNLTDETARRERLLSQWRAIGGQSPFYIQSTLQSAGFNLYVHEWWEPNPPDPNVLPAFDIADWNTYAQSSIAAGVATINGVGGPTLNRVDTMATYLWKAGTTYTVRIKFITFSDLGAGNFRVLVDGVTHTFQPEELPAANEFLEFTFVGAGGITTMDFRTFQLSCDIEDPFAGIVVNAVPRNPFDYIDDGSTFTSTLTFGDGSTFGNVTFGAFLDTEALGYLLVNNPPSQHNIPVDDTKWPYFLYLGAEEFPFLLPVLSARKSEIDTLALKICPAQQWLGMLIRYYDTLVAWDTAKEFTYNAVSTDVDSPSTDQFFKPDGLVMFTSTGSKIIQYDLPTAWDVTNRVKVSEVDKSADSTDIVSIFIDDTGGRIFTVDGTSRIIRGYDFSTAWELSTISGSVDTSADISGTFTTIEDAYLDNTGDRVYVTGISAAASQVGLYSLTLGLDLSGLVFIEIFNLGAVNAGGIYFKSDDVSVMYVASIDGPFLHTYDLFPFGTVAGASKQAQVLNLDITSPIEFADVINGLNFRPDGEYFYVGTDKNNVYEFILVNSFI